MSLAITSRQVFFERPHGVVAGMTTTTRGLSLGIVAGGYRRCGRLAVPALWVKAHAIHSRVRRV